MNAPDKAKATAMRPLPEDALILIPMRNTVLFPGVISPITVGRPSSIAAAQEAVRTNKPIGFLLQREADKNDVKPNDLYWVGTSGNVVRYITGNEGAHHLVVQGQSRIRVLEFLEGWPFLVARVTPVEARDETNPEIEARFLQLKQQASEAIELLPGAPGSRPIVSVACCLICRKRASISGLVSSPASTAATRATRNGQPSRNSSTRIRFCPWTTRWWAPSLPVM